MPSTYTECKVITTSHTLLGDVADVKAEILETLPTYKRVVDVIWLEIENYSQIKATEDGVENHILQVYNAAQV